MPAVAGMDRGDMALQELLAVDAAFTMPMLEIKLRAQRGMAFHILTIICFIPPKKPIFL